MRIHISTALATMTALSSAGLSEAKAHYSTYTYNPDGEPNGEGGWLPGPGAWGGQCNDPNAKQQTPIAVNNKSVKSIKTSDFNIGSYTFNVSRRCYCFVFTTIWSYSSFDVVVIKHRGVVLTLSWLSLFLVSVGGIVLTALYILHSFFLQGWKLHLQGRGVWRFG